MKTAYELATITLNAIEEQKQTKRQAAIDFAETVLAPTMEEAATMGKGHLQIIKPYGLEARVLVAYLCELGYEATFDGRRLQVKWGIK